MSFAVAELGPDQEGGYSPRGAVRELWKGRHFETIVSGPAETGKTYGSLQYADALLWKYPGAQGVMARKTYASLVGTAVRTYQRILGPDSPVRPYGGSKPEWFDYPNGSRLWVAGLDKPGKALSAERDFFYVNQVEELTLEDWETLTTRCTGRGAVMPYTRIFGDCNPGPPSHWIKRRPSIRLLESRHEDNPALFDDNGGVTAQGVKTLGILDSLTGARKQRLRFGRWVQAEGVVYEGWDARVHLIDRSAVSSTWPRIWVVDFGYSNPFVWQDWRLDGDGRAYLVREIYLSQRLVEDHARRILHLTAGEPAPIAVVCDHDAEGRATLERHLKMRTTSARKAVREGIQLVAARLRPAGDGKPRLFIMRDALDQRDPQLVEAKKPCCTADEWDSYVWDRGSNRKLGEEPVKLHDHGMDCVRYLCAHLDMPRRVGGAVGHGGR